MKRYVILLLCGLVLCAGPSYGSDSARADETGAISLQLRLFDMLAAKNPGYEDTLAAWPRLNHAERMSQFAALFERNEKDPQIEALIDSLLTTPTYQLYYKQFSNVTTDTHFKVFNSLPYSAAQSPADIGGVQLELFRNRDSLKALLKVVDKVDPERAMARALKWVPDGQKTPPPIYYIMDGNGDAFARDGKVCFDLYSLVLSPRPQATRYSGLADIPVDRIEGILAHEFQHVLAEPYLYPPSRSFDKWQDEWEDIIIRRMVSEGVAMQADPVTGFRKAVYEDTVIVKHWIRDLERVVGEMRSNKTAEDQVQNWLNASYQDEATTLLRGFIERNYATEERAAVLSDHRSERPSLVYTLGWWMVSHIVAAPGGHDAAVQLLSKPHDLFSLYNATVTNPSFKIDL